jgi:hypothetical protein
MARAPGRGDEGRQVLRRYWLAVLVMLVVAGVIAGCGGSSSGGGSTVSDGSTVFLEGSTMPRANVLAEKVRLESARARLVVAKERHTAAAARAFEQEESIAESGDAAKEQATGASVDADR